MYGWVFKIFVIVIILVIVVIFIVITVIILLFTSYTELYIDITFKEQEQARLFRKILWDGKTAREKTLDKSVCSEKVLKVLALRMQRMQEKQKRSSHPAHLVSGIPFLY